MKNRILLLTVLFLFAASAAAQKTDLRADLDSMVATERAFAQTATVKGIRDSFLSYIADDGVLFRPGPVVGKKWLTENPPAQGLLSWEPAFADISRSGDLGYTTGPWEFRRNNTDAQPSAYGHFVTVWKKQADGTWKFVIDLGINHPKAAPKPSNVQSPLPLRKTWQKVNVETGRAILLEVEHKFSRELEARGIRETFLSFLADTGRLYRSGAFPLSGHGDFYTALSAQLGTLTFQPVKADIASAGDLGYTYGSYEFRARDSADKQATRGNYLRIWKKQNDGRWKIVLDVANPLPPATTS